MNIEETHQPRQSDQKKIIYWPDRIIPTLVTYKITSCLVYVAVMAGLCVA